MCACVVMEERGKKRTDRVLCTNNTFYHCVSADCNTREQYEQTYGHRHTHLYKKDLNVIYNAIIQEININAM